MITILINLLIPLDDLVKVLIAIAQLSSAACAFEEQNTLDHFEVAAIFNNTLAEGCVFISGEVGAPVSFFQLGKKPECAHSLGFGDVLFGSFSLSQFARSLRCSDI